MKEKEKVEINDGHYHEMLDRLHVQMSVLEEHVLSHPVADKHKEVKRLIIRAIVTLVQAYQITGGITHEKIEKKKTARRGNSKNNNK